MAENVRNGCTLLNPFICTYTLFIKSFTHNESNLALLELWITARRPSRSGPSSAVTGGAAAAHVVRRR